MLKIGNVEIENNVFLAPMASVCNSAFRRIIKEQGCGLVYAEMVSDKAIVYDSEKTKGMLYMTDMERPIVQQIFGADVSSFVEAAKKVYEYMKPDIIDINMGCPVPKIAVKQQAGSALLKNPEKIREIVSSVVKSVPCPVTVKIRSGWDEKSINAPLVAKICEESGASAICIHGRTRKQGYSGTVDLSIIKKVKMSVTIPVIGNGDIRTVEDAVKMFEVTGCDAVMIGRGVLSNPFLIRQILDYMEKGTYSEVTPIMKIDTAIKHLNYLLETNTEKFSVLEVRKNIGWYLKGLPNSGPIKQAIFKTLSSKEVINILLEYRKEFADE